MAVLLRRVVIRFMAILLRGVSLTALLPGVVLAVFLQGDTLAVLWRGVALAVLLQGDALAVLWRGVALAVLWPDIVRVVTAQSENLFYRRASVP